MTLPIASVVVPVYNRAATIGPCLDSLLVSEYPADRMGDDSAEGSANEPKPFVALIRLAGFGPKSQGLKNSPH